jgi:hypothetical protein
MMQKQGSLIDGVHLEKVAMRPMTRRRTRPAVAVTTKLLGKVLPVSTCRSVVLAGTVVLRNNCVRRTHPFFVHAANGSKRYSWCNPASIGAAMTRWPSGI